MKNKTAQKTLSHWEETLKGQEAINRQWCEAYNNADTDEEKKLLNKVLVLIKNRIVL